jgi:thiosulfate/3-mercaptopyruvate sulfurtransferase
VLDGGLSAWTASGGAMEFGAVQPPLDGSFVASMNNQLFLDTPGVKAMVDGADAALIVCATPRAEFTGEGSSDRRRGHIPGSFNLPYAEILDASGHMDLQRLSGDIGRLGAGPDERLARYCGGGVNAAGLALGLMALGHSKLAIYDGSLNEWRADLALPLETGAVALPDPSRTEATR